MISTLIFYSISVPKRVSFEGIARGVTAFRGLRAFNASMSSISSSGSVESLGGDDFEEPESTKTAVLNRSSTVHRSLAVNSGAERLRR